MIYSNPSFWTDKSRQAVQTKIRPVLRSSLVRIVTICLFFFGPLVYGKTISFRLNSNFLWCPVFTVYFLFNLICSVYHLLAGGGPVNAKPAPNAPQAIVIEPSRELAEQVSISLPNTPPTVRGGPFNYQTSPLCSTGHRIQPSRELAEQVSIPLPHSLFDSRRWSVNTKPAPNAPQAIVIEPFRELAEQVSVPLSQPFPNCRRRSNEC